MIDYVGHYLPASSSYQQFYPTTCPPGFVFATVRTYHSLLCRAPLIYRRAALTPHHRAARAATLRYAAPRLARLPFVFGRRVYLYLFYSPFIDIVHILFQFYTRCLVVVVGQFWFNFLTFFLLLLVHVGDVFCVLHTIYICLLLFCSLILHVFLH